MHSVRQDCLVTPWQVKPWKKLAMQEGYRKFTAEEQEQMYQDALRKRQERQKRLAEDAAKNATASIPASQAQIIQPIQVKRSIPNDFFAPIAKPVEPAHKKPSISLPTIKPKLQLISESKFEITATPSVITALQQVGLLTGPVKDGKIQVPLASRNALVNKLPFNVRPSSNDDIPKTVLTAFEPGAVAQRNAAKNIKINLQNSIPDKLLQDMFPFQVEGVKSAIARGGKILIGDEMGLGKSLQALAVASYYRFEWPLLIVAPASMVANWREQVYTWIPELQKEQVQAVFSGVKVAELTGSVVIMSYDLACRLADLIKQKNFRVIIADESHCMRNAKTKRCKTMIPILQATPRSILLSGTPALSRPCELHSQISAIMPKLFPKSMDYDRRYCDGHQTYFGWDNKGSSNETELTTILENLIMIRRTKDQVLSQLPPKLRRQIFLEIPQDAKKKLKASTEELFNPELLVDGADVDALLRSMSNNNRYLQLYRDTAKAKMPAMLDYISDLLDAGHKFILFVHHMETLDQFSQYFEKEVINTMDVCF